MTIQLNSVLKFLSENLFEINFAVQFLLQAAFKVSMKENFAFILYQFYKQFFLLF